MRVKTALLFIPWISLAAAQFGCVPLISYDTVLSSNPAAEFLQIDGQWVHIERKGAGEPLILIHGFGGSTLSFHKVIDPLSESFDVIAIDLNAFGYTQRPSGTAPYSARGQMKLVTSVMDNLGIDSAHLLGHSYGAGIVLLIAADAPERSRSVVLVDGSAPRGGGTTIIPPALLPLASALIQAFVINEQTVRDGLLSSVHNPETITDEMVQGYYDRIRVEGLGRGLEGILGASGGEPLNFEFASITQPVLILWGEHDQLIPISVGEQTNASLPGSQLVRFANSAHLPMEEEPEKFVETVKKFLTK